MKRAAFLLAGAIVALGVVTAGTAGVQALITSAQIKDGTIASRDIKNGSIARADISADTLTSLRGPRGLAGAAGGQGPAGAQGAQGPAGPQGPQGEKGAQGEKGDKGNPGDDVHVTGSVATAAELPVAAEAGDAYIAKDTSHLHVFDGKAFVDTGLVQGPKGDQGAKGDKGDKGDQGAQGLQGPAGGLSGYEIVEGDPVAVDADDYDVYGESDCPAGKRAVGGGASFESPASGVAMVESFPTATGDGWLVTAINQFEESNVMTPYAICAEEA